MAANFTSIRIVSETNIFTAGRKRLSSRSGANLKSANLSNADLRHANLHGADVTARQLADAKSIAGTTLPDGTKPG